MLRFLLFTTLVLSPIASVAQGEWSPDGATLTRPRLIITPTEVETLRVNLGPEQAEAAPHFRKIYTELYNDAIHSTPPGDTLETSPRRANARLAKNVAFVLTIDRAPTDDFSGSIPGEDRTRLIQKLILSLSRINPSVEGALEYTEWQWRTKELIDYLSAYDMALGLGLDQDVAIAGNALHTFAGTLYREATREVLGLGFFTLVRNNHALMVCGALGAAAIVLNDAGSSDPALQPANWIDAALWWCDDLLWRADDRLSEPDEIAGYAEGPHYLRYAWLNLLPFYRGLANVYRVDSIEVHHGGSMRMVPHPFTDRATLLLAEWATRIMTPEGLLPSIEDTFVDEAFPETALLGDDRFSHPIFSPFTTLSASLRSTVDMRANYLATGMLPRHYEWKGEDGSDDLAIFPVAGIAVLQSNDRTEQGQDRAKTLQLGVLGEHGRSRIEGGGHNQSDGGSFYLNYGGRRLALDPGYLSYARRAEVIRAEHHNTILVDGSGPEPGAVGSVGGADAFIDVVWEPKEISSDASGPAPRGSVRVTTAYEGAEIERQFFLVDNAYVIVADRVQSTTPHAFTWQLHGIDARRSNAESAGSYSATLRGDDMAWLSDSVSMTAHLASSDPSLTHDTIPGVHETGYNRTAPHTTFRGTTGMTEETLLLSAIRPTADTSEESVRSARGDQSVDIMLDRFRHLWSIATDTGERKVDASGLANSPETLHTDGRLLGFSGSDGENLFEWVILQEGRHVSGEIDYIRFDAPNSIFALHDGPYSLQVEVKGPGTLSIATLWEEASLFAEGTGVVDWHMERSEIGPDRIVVTVDRPTIFRLGAGSDVDGNRSTPDELDLSTTTR